MVLHPEHWSPAPNHRDPTLRPFLDDWRLVASLCTQAARWLHARVDNDAQRVEEEVTEVVPTTPLAVDLHLRKADARYTHLFEETTVAGFKPMLDLVPKVCVCLVHSVCNFLWRGKLAQFRGHDRLCSSSVECLGPLSPFLLSSLSFFRGRCPHFLRCSPYLPLSCIFSSPCTPLPLFLASLPSCSFSPSFLFSHSSASSLLFSLIFLSPFLSSSFPKD